MKLSDITPIEYFIYFLMLLTLISIIKGLFFPNYTYVIPEHIQSEKIQKIDKCIQNVTTSQVEDVDKAIIQCKSTYDLFYADKYVKVRTD